MKTLVFILALLVSGSGAIAQTIDPIATTNPTSTVTTKTHSIADDGYANVPLQFSFPYYGQTFNNSWMFSNGIVSFVDPDKSGLSWYNLAVQPFSTTMGSQFNYSIYPLWTDLINLGGTFQTQGSKEFQRYNWVGISPFYDSTRLNTFSVELRPDGKIITSYNSINANYASIGLTGDTSKGEYEQIAYYPYTTTTNMTLNWERYTSAPEVNLCNSNPFSSSSCPGYPKTPETNNTGQFTNSEPIMEASITVAPVSISSIAPATTENITTISAPVSSTAETSTSRTNNVNAVDIARSVNNLVASQTQAIVAQSIQQSLVAETSGDQSNNNFDNGSSGSLGTGLTVSNNSFSVSGSASSQSFNSVAIEGPIQSFNNSLMSSNNGMSLGFESLLPNNNSSNSSSLTTDTTSPTSTFSLSTMSNRFSMSTDSDQNNNKENIKSNIEPIAEFSTGVDARQLQVVPIGFNAYLSAKIQDNTFYAPRDIYKGQNNVDNARALRQLASDRLHEEMVNQQYKR